MDRTFVERCGVFGGYSVQRLLRRRKALLRQRGNTSTGLRSVAGVCSLQFSPQGPGHSSVGVRIDRMYYFKGGRPAGTIHTPRTRTIGFPELPKKG